MASRNQKVRRVMKAPGEGLLTVSTGAEKIREQINKDLGKTKKNWSEEIQMRLKTTSGPKASPFLVGIPSDAGGGICRGAAHGPLHLRPLLYRHGWANRDLGDIPCIPQLSHDTLLSNKQKQLCGKALWGKDFNSSLPVSPLNLLAEFLAENYQAHPNTFRPMILGGDHSISWASFEALKKARLSNKCALLHLDAHTDLMETRYGIEHCFATWTSHALKTLRSPKQCIQVGIRKSLKDKSHWEKKFGLTQYWMKDLKGQDAKELAKLFVKQWKSLGCERLYISIDIDALDAGIAPSTGTPENDGLKLNFARALIHACSKEFSVIGADLVEVAPVLGSDAKAKRTLNCAVTLIQAIEW